MAPVIPVLVVGAGPVGLATAIALRLYGIDCTVAEGHASPFDFPKGRGVTVRTMEIFRQWGIETEVAAAGLPEAEQGLFVGETLLGDAYRRFDAAALGRSPSPSPTERLVCAQDLVERILLRRALELGAEVRWSTRVAEIHQRDAAVVAVLSEGQMLEAAYLVAADGARSQVREQLGIARSGPGAVRPTLSVLFEAELRARVADRLSTIYKVARPHASAFVAVVDNNRRWLLMMTAEGPIEEYDEQRCAQLVHAALGDDGIAIRILGRRIFTPTALVADRFREGRVLLAGDAAHVVRPFGGLGMNCGIADAHNLGWKLAGVLNGWADPALLDTYDHERRPVAQATAAASIPPDTGGGPLRASFTGISLGSAYSSRAVIADGTPAPVVADPVHDYVPCARPGHRAPHLPLPDGRSTLDLFGRAFVLLADGCVPPLPQARIPLEAHALRGAAWREAYDIGPSGLVLVRPDGHVAWRMAEPPADVGATVARALEAAACIASTPTHASPNTSPAAAASE